MKKQAEEKEREVQELKRELDSFKKEEQDRKALLDKCMSYL